MVQPNFYPAMHVKPKTSFGDIAQAGMQGLAFAQQYKTGQLKNQMLEAEMGRQSELQGVRKRLFGDAPGGDPASGLPADPSAAGQGEQGSLDQGTFLKYAAMDPQGAKQMWDVISGMDAASREEARDKVETFGPMAMGVLQTEPINQPGAYRTLLEEGKRMGIKGMPEDWSQDTMAWLGLQTMKAMSMPEAMDYLEEEEEASGFTLSQGQTRFDASGNPIAGVPSKPDKPDNFTLSGGQTRFDASGNPIASVSPKPDAVKSSYQFGNILANDEILPGRQNSATGDVEVLSGGEWAPAQGGQFVSEASPYKVMPNALGKSTLVDTGTMEQVWPKPEEQSSPETLPTQGIDPTIDYSAATGGSGFFGGLANTFTDALGWGLQAPNMELAARTLDRLMTVTSLELAAEMPGRDTNYVRERLASLEVKPQTLMEGDERSRLKLEQIRELSVLEYNRAQKVADDPGSYSTGQVQAAVDNSSKIRELIDQYDKILSNWGGTLQPGGETVIDGVPVRRIK